MILPNISSQYIILTLIIPVVEAESGEQDTTNSQVNQRFQAVLKSLNNTHQEAVSSSAHPYLFAARFFRLNHNLFADFDAVIREGVLAEFDPMPAAPVHRSTAVSSAETS
ncbi:hypothetical protein EV424DRAFT_1374797 [Suillus variegatus]|nr:hypothetical protein EV424DRAFT_1374797 [Suillus variegatus]